VDIFRNAAVTTAAPGRNAASRRGAGAVSAAPVSRTARAGSSASPLLDGGRAVGDGRAAHAQYDIGGCLAGSVP
jgi:hypothetical protein